jgi:hypothetical protein
MSTGQTHSHFTSTVDTKQNVIVIALTCSDVVEASAELAWDRKFCFARRRVLLLSSFDDSFHSRGSRDY